ncbi:hypothetical protein, partial [Xanthomonas arboricola]|uniref:hypothetical protein n=1 Tax=Xanthomonas arboricola TaxID=56448 RepID=UPI001E558382
MSMSPQITAWQGAKGYALSARVPWRYPTSALPSASACLWFWLWFWFWFWFWFWLWLGFGFCFGFSQLNFAQKETLSPVGLRVSGKAPGDDLLSHG